jgi:hypothetical protein
MARFVLDIKGTGRHDVAARSKKVPDDDVTDLDRQLDNGLMDPGQASRDILAQDGLAGFDR